MSVETTVASMPALALSAGGRHLVFCSDLHLGDASGDCRYDGDFEKFLATLRASRARTGTVRLVLLGDVLDFAELRSRRGLGGRRATQEQSLGLLDDIVDAHPRVFSAMAKHLDAGFDLDFVVGNHDADLAWPAVQTRLRQRLDAHGAGTGALRFHPWLFYLPGLVYAEHGHQHHDINAFTTVLRPWRGAALETSMGEALADFRSSTRSPQTGRAPHPGPARGPYPGRARAASAFLHVLAIQFLRKSGPWWRLARVRYRRGTLGAFARAVGLPAKTVRALDLLTAHSGARIVWRVARVAGRCLSGRTREDYLYAAARRVHAVLLAGGGQVPFYVFGHTHAAARRPLADAANTPTYLNTGTWSPYGRGEDVGAGPTFVLVTDDADSLRACLYRYGRACE